MLKKLDWDSAFFKYPVYKLSLDKSDNLNETLESLLKTDFKLAYLFSKEKIIQETNLISSCSLNLVDQKVTFGKKNIPNIKKDLNIINNSKYLNQISKLCIQSGEYSRFNVDKNFHLNEFTRLYEIWGVNAFNNMSKTILAEFDEFDNIIGLAIVSPDHTTLHIEIIAVEHKKRKNGVGTELMKQIYSFCIKNNYNKIEVITQLNNKTACSFYKKNGFFLINQKYIYHIWKK